MGYFGSSFADGPVLALAPQTAHQAFTLGKSTFQTRPNHAAFARRFANANMTPSRPSGAGRKRSREEAEPNLSEDLPEPTPAPSSNTSWLSGNDMLMMETAQPTAAAILHNAEVKTALQMQQEQQASGRSYKTQRREITSAAATPVDEFSSPSPSLATPITEMDNHPVVDDFTLHLGIGWRRIGNDEHIQAAARGWARFIENHYPISNVVIQLESKGLQSYLIEASEGYFLFDENLRQGRLVSRTGEGALQNLKSNPPVFDGPETMMAASQPSLPIHTQQANYMRALPFGNADLEMEVC
ncbi:unnamed protein product [Parascedosporium putredinis]|uniref:Uncharacterized protein n=1 Tax=Parascedosporium putredinis TaxID=1442378 RepID=A0A9P1GX04_9PEZI|nr:unnamed protein product [Parascedosporium putredinis]CAI7988735.1 unnamed protein product [Parascedosporium putredinis]